MYLGIDLGTSGLKAILVDENQSIIASALAELTVTRPHPGWSEQDPASWISACETVLDRLQASHPDQLAAVKAIGLSGHMHGATLIDASGKPVRDCILWNDTRSHAQAAALDADPDFRAIGGNIVFPGFTAPKLVWVQQNEREIFAKTAKVLLPKDYLRLWLTGEAVSEMSDAAGTAWLDVAKRDWSLALLGKSGMGIEHMPRLVEGNQVSGQLRSVLGARWGMRQSVTVAGGAGDNAASAVGIGAVSDNQAFISLGTSGVLFAANNAYLPKPESAVHTFCHALPNTWHQMGVILSATDALNWYAGITGQQAAELTNALGQQLHAPSPVTFLPYLSGERTPHNDAAIRGTFAHLSHSDDRNSLTNAVLSGVAFALRDNLEALRSAGTELASMTAVGGGSKSDYWLDLIATVLNIEVNLPEAGDFGGAFGAARLAIMADTGAPVESVCTPPKIIKTHRPVESHSAAYDEAYHRYTRLYPAMKEWTQ